MKNRTKKEIEDKVKEIWKDAFFYDDDFQHAKCNEPEITVRVAKDLVEIRLSAMYEAPGLSLKKLMALAEFFDTQNISDPDTFANSGCETCDYGSSYGFSLEIKPEEKKGKK
jgi:hypothetical protein